jgi:biopolymer transport protein ExbD
MPLYARQGAGEIDLPRIMPQQLIGAEARSAYQGLEQGREDAADREGAREVRRPRVFVRGDAKTYHQNIVAVLNACQEAGITDVSLATEK